MAAAQRFYGDGGRLANQDLTPNEFIDPATGTIDYSRSSWSRSSWSTSWTKQPFTGPEGAARSATSLGAP